MNERYFILNNNTATLDEETGKWKIDLPMEFVNSNKPKSITILNFMFFMITTPHRQDECDTSIVYTSLHSSTLTDGNTNQEDHYITSLSFRYTYNTVFKTYPIKSRAQSIEFWFKDEYGEIIKDFEIPIGSFPENSNVGGQQKFVIELLLKY